MPLGAAHTPGQIITAAAINAIETEVNLKLASSDASATFPTFGTAKNRNRPNRDLAPSLGSFTKVAVPFAPAAGTWKSSKAGIGMDVVWDHSTRRYAMVYGGFDGTTLTFGLAYSDDLKTWTDYGSNPFFSPNGTGGQPDSGGITYPQLLWDGTQWVMYYIGFPSAGFEVGTPKVCYATATTLTGTWTRHGAVLTPTDFPGGMTVCYRPNVSKINNTWYMFINAGATAGVEDIYYATAPAATGPWTVQAKIVNGTDFAGGTIASDPEVVRIGDWFVMFLWANPGVYVAYCDASEFPGTWHTVNSTVIGGGVIRPTYIDSPSGPALFVNGAVGTTVEVHRPAVLSDAAPALLQPITGRFYRPQGVVTVSTDSLGDGYVTFAPFRVEKGATLATLNINVTAGSGAVRLGVFADDGNGKPGALVVDGGAVNTATTGQKSTSTLGTFLKPGLYWLASKAEGGSPTVTVIASAATTPAVTDSLAGAFGNLFGWFGGAFASGAFPATAGALGTISPATGDIPLVVCGFS